MNATTASADDVAKAFDAAKAAGAPLVMDEANRLAAEVWDVFAAKAKETGVHVACTLNPNFPDAKEIPEAIKSEALSLDFAVPPYNLIIEVMVSCFGFIDSEELGTKMASLFEALKG